MRAGDGQLIARLFAEATARLEAKQVKSPMYNLPAEDGENATQTAGGKELLDYTLKKAVLVAIKKRKEYGTMLIGGQDLMDFLEAFPPRSKKAIKKQNVGRRENRSKAAGDDAEDGTEAEHAKNGGETTPRRGSVIPGTPGSIALESSEKAPAVKGLKRKKRRKRMKQPVK